MNTLLKNSTLAALALTMAIPIGMSAPISAEAGSRDAFVGGLVGGVIGGAIGSSHRGRDVVYVETRPVYRERVVVRRGHGNAHINWCLNRYRSYDIGTDTYVSYGGRVKYCNSPYN